MLRRCLHAASCSHATRVLDAGPLARTSTAGSGSVELAVGARTRAQGGRHRCVAQSADRAIALCWSRTLVPALSVRGALTRLHGFDRSAEPSALAVLPRRG